ncbi:MULTISPECIES: SAV_915 family protein [unclassified Streptomyces]|uniref:SAV_915 family protein n=1 Tax=unclassified Streptomyces TaxID=2593676 RepID=UPI003647B713
MRTPLGVRTAIGFTSQERLAAVLGEGQASVRLAEPALRALAEPLGITVLTVDPQFTAPSPAAAPSLVHTAPAGPGGRRPERDPDTIGVPRLTGAAALLLSAAAAFHAFLD